MLTCAAEGLDLRIRAPERDRPAFTRYREIEVIGAGARVSTGAHVPVGENEVSTVTSRDRDRAL